MSLNQPFEGSHPALFKQFQRFLHDQFARGRRTIFIVDEAQNLGLEALEELRMLSNINTDKHQFLQIILVGQPQLKDLLRAPQLLQFAQRISSDFHLRPLNADEVIEVHRFSSESRGITIVTCSPMTRAGSSPIPAAGFRARSIFFAIPHWSMASRPEPK